MTTFHSSLGAVSLPVSGASCTDNDNDRNNYGEYSGMGLSATARTSFDNARDFVPTLPYDVVILIFEHLDYLTRVRCTAVSKTWRRFLFCEWNGLSRTVHLEPNDSMGYFKANMAKWLLTHLIPSDVQRFIFLGVGAHMPELIRVLHTARYAFLNTLCLEVCTVTYSMERQLFWEVIQTCSPCLRKLVLRGIALPLDDDTWNMVFTMCRRLQYLTCYIPSTGARPSFLRLDSIPSELQLTSLHWGSTAQLPYGSLLSRCPRLRHFLINTANETVTQVELLLEYIHTLCSELQTIKLQKNLYPTIDYEDDDYLPLSPGLRRAVLQGSNLTERGMATVIIRNQSTLLDISLNYKATTLDASMFWRHLEPLQYPLPLQAFEYDGFHQRDSQASSMELCQFLGKCPALRKLTVTNISCNESHLCDVLSHCQKLTKIHLRHVYSDWGIAHTAILDTYPLMHCRHMESLALDECSLITDHFVNRLSDLNCLTYVRLVKCNNISARGLEAFFTKSMPQLRLVYAEQMVHLNDKACIAMARLPRLARVCFVACPNITDQGIDCLIEAGKIVVPCRCSAI